MNRIAIVLSALALLVAIAALFVAIANRGGDETPGRVITIDNLGRFEVGSPVLFEDDEFYLVRGKFKADNGTFDTWVAFYNVVPHSHFGLVKGCRIRWEPDRTFGDGEDAVTGVFNDPCGGSKFDVIGKRLFGPSPHGLDTFSVTKLPEDDFLTVDTRLLFCDNPTTDTLPCMRTLADSD